MEKLTVSQSPSSRYCQGYNDAVDEAESKILEMQSEIDELKELVYMVDQRNEQGEGNLITYKDAYLNLEQTYNSLLRGVKNAN